MSKKTFYLRNQLGNLGKAMIIPPQDQQPDWLIRCNLWYREDGKTVSVPDGLPGLSLGLISGRIGHDTIVYWGDYPKNGEPMVDIVFNGTENYRGLTPCNADGTDL